MPGGYLSIRISETEAEAIDRIRNKLNRDPSQVTKVSRSDVGRLALRKLFEADAQGKLQEFIRGDEDA
ncbi:hypothetical protein [Alicyclobacillus kakegawensis]|uniref:hypothetical protein n=1 Tax=Alicyclobacillus kakegawensis TaxID=392012 RepID=UPI00083054E2|nr:hypothetical protein [Alicyclobacillus kakegawensis]